MSEPDIESKNGKLEWNAPKGEWKLIALFVGKTLQKVKRAAPGGEGYVMDHMNPEAVKEYFTKFDRAFKQNKATYPRTFFNDSYEVYKADWTPHLLEEFERRRAINLKNTFLNLRMLHVRKQLAVSCPIIVKLSAKC